MISVFKAILKNSFEFILHPIRQLFSFLRRAIPGLKWLASLRPEVLIAVLVFIILVAIWIFAHFAAERGDASFWIQVRDAGVTLGLIVAISVVVYVSVRIALQPPKSPYPDIDESWSVGLKELEKAGLQIRELPLYLVLGMRDSKQIRSFMDSSGDSFEVEGVTGSGQGLIWYASKDHAFLFLTSVGNFTEFAAKSQNLPMLHGEQEQDFIHTANIKDFYNVPKHQSEVDEEDEQVEVMQTVRAADASPAGTTTAAELDRPPSREDEVPRETARAKRGEQRKRLDHLSSLICRTRNPVSPVNGLIVNADVNVLESYPEELSRQLRNDLSGLTSELGIVCAMTIVISGLERDKGFINFADRLIKENGEEFVKSKFGKSYRTWTPPSTEQLEQVATAAVEEFDHFVHLIFTKRDALSAENVQGNRKLALFVCRLYSTILPGLKVLLGKGCGLPPSMADVDFPRFAGCYFVGNDPQRDYFLQKVFDRVDENQGELEWTRDATRREENWRILANLAYLVGLSSLIGFVYLAVSFYFND